MTQNRLNGVAIGSMTILLCFWLCPCAVGAEGPAAAPSTGRIEPSTGEHEGHKWRIDANHLMWWDDEPYVRFAFTGNGDLVEMLDAGFDQFVLTPAERWPIDGPDPEIVESVNEFSKRLEKAGASYYANLNLLWPWRYGDLMDEGHKAEVFFRHVRDVTEYAGSSRSLDIEVWLPLQEGRRDKLVPAHVEVVLFDLDRWVSRDLSAKIDSVRAIPVEARPQEELRTDDDRPVGRMFRVRLKKVELPESSSLRLVTGMCLRQSGLPGVNGLVPLWKPGIRRFYESSLRAFRSAYAGPNLRGMQFGDEINTWPVSLTAAHAYLDIRKDAIALKAYRKWLSRRFESIGELNRRFRETYGSFDEVGWRVPLHPFDPELARTDRGAEREESWAGAQTAWGLAGSVDQLWVVSRTQREFLEWFYGHWLAEYAKLAKEIIGDVPVFVCSAAIGGDADRYLAMHRWALREGVDGLIRNHYGNCGPEERYALASLAAWMDRVQRESGCTKHLWANEVGYVRPHMTDDEWAAAEGAELDPLESFGSQWAFPSRESLREMLVLLSEYGYKGFNRFLMNPSARRAAREVRWMAELRDEIVPQVAGSTGTGGDTVVPLPHAHAHNDYRHYRPLLDALSHGFCSVEADIFLVGEELFVAHDRADLRPERSLRRLYLDPLRERCAANAGRVYANGPQVTLLIDIKSEAAPTYRALHALLAEYRDIMTRCGPDGRTDKAIVAIVSGNRPRELMASQKERLAFYDGRLGDLESDAPAELIPLISDRWTSHFQWRGVGAMPAAERRKLKAIVEKAHAKGRRVRFWATPDARSPAREALWSVLLDADVDLINTDDLEGLRRFLLEAAR